jgi:hypothetical protein
MKEPLNDSFYGTKSFDQRFGPRPKDNQMTLTSHGKHAPRTPRRPPHTRRLRSCCMTMPQTKPTSDAMTQSIGADITRALMRGSAGSTVARRMG